MVVGETHHFRKHPYVFFHVKKTNNIQFTTKTGNTMNLSWFVGIFFWGAGLGIDFGAQKHTT